MRTALVPASQFQAHDRNWRIHGRAQQRAMDGVLGAVGFVQAVLVNLRTSEQWPRNERGVETVVDGHLRIQRALTHGDETEVPTVFVDLEPEEERLVLATLDPIGSMAGRDADMLDGLATEVATDWADSPGIDLAEILDHGTRRRVTFEAGSACNVLVICGDVDTQRAVMERLTAEGLACKATART